MKKFICLILCIGLSVLFFPSCLKEYLDKAPEAGMDEVEVFSKYDNFMLYFDGIYHGKQPGITTYEFSIKLAYPLYFDLNVYAGAVITTWEALTDNADMDRFEFYQNFKNGVLGSLASWLVDASPRRPIFKSMFIVIRKCNKALRNVEMLTNATQKDIDDIIAQAHFLRALAHFTLLKGWGGMPYITHVIGPDDEWDLPRLERHETLMNICADLDTALIYFEKAGLMRRDPGPGQIGHLSSPDQFRPNGVAAKALKARALLYAASPLNNKNGITDWEAAAKANWEAIQLALQYEYGLLPGERYKENYVGVQYTNEQIWGWNAGKWAYTNTAFREIICGYLTGSKTVDRDGESPTQNLVDKFETIWGDPLKTQEERDAATALGHYNEQDPYSNRDPRLAINIIYNTAPLLGFGTAKIYRELVDGKMVYGEMLDRSYRGCSNTGYFNRKYWGNQSIKNPIQPEYTNGIIRLAELYLNYAEAANEAYGPNTPAPGATMTAVQAVNIIRNRIGQPDVLAQFTSNREAFRERIKNEWEVEFNDEGFSFWNMRRWLDATERMSATFYGIDVEKVPVSPEYPTGYKYTRVPLDESRQGAWKDYMYWFPLTANEIYKMKNFDAIHW